ncbi:MAG: PstS family phosphate ABC transporter substrate-binding protein [Tepidisphaeraceae bacterium]
MVSLLKKTAAVAVLALGASVAAAQQDIKIDGSSTVYPITEAVAEEFQKENTGTKVTVGVSGTGGGFKKFVRGETDISNASRPIKSGEMEEAKKAGIEYLEIPVAFDALTVVINPSNDWVKELTVEDLKKMWSPDAQGKVTTWNQIRPEWPNVPLKLYGPGGDSGTFEYFTEAVVGKAKSSRGDYTASEDDNILVQGVSGDKGALGYFGYAYFAENKDKLKAVPIVNKAGKAIEPSPAAVKEGSYNPLARPIFIYVNARSMKDKPAIKTFTDYYLKNAEDLVKEVKYVPLPAEAYDALVKRVDSGKTGTVFGGKEQVGMTIDELLTAELKQ